MISEDNFTDNFSFRNNLMTKDIFFMEISKGRFLEHDNILDLFR